MADLMHHNRGGFFPEVLIIMRIAFARAIVAVSLGALVAAGFPVSARAGMIGTQAALDAQSAADVQAAPGRRADLDKVQASLARADVRARLQSLGVNPADAAARVAALPDSDLARLAHGVDKLPAGADDGLLALIGFVFLVLLLLDYLDVIHVFSHAHHR
jgi:hypothetical protein